MPQNSRILGLRSSILLESGSLTMRLIYKGCLLDNIILLSQIGGIFKERRTAVSQEGFSCSSWVTSPKPNQVLHLCRGFPLSRLTKFSVVFGQKWGAKRACGRRLRGLARCGWQSPASSTACRGGGSTSAWPVKWSILQAFPVFCFSRSQHNATQLNTTGRTQHNKTPDSYATGGRAGRSTENSTEKFGQKTLQV